MPTMAYIAASYQCFLLPYTQLPLHTYELICCVELPPIAYGFATTDICNFVPAPVD